LAFPPVVSLLPPSTWAPDKEKGTFHFSWLRRDRLYDGNRFRKVECPLFYFSTRSRPHSLRDLGRGSGHRQGVQQKQTVLLLLPGSYGPDQENGEYGIGDVQDVGEEGRPAHGQDTLNSRSVTPAKSQEEVPGHPYVVADPTCGELSDLDENNQVVPGTTLSLVGRGFAPNTETQIWWADALGNEFVVRQAGEYVVFQSNRDGNWEIYTMDGNGHYQVNVSQSSAADASPSSTGSWIYFQSNRDGNWEIYRMNSDGSAQTRLTNHVAADAEPSCATDGRVAFQSIRDGNWEIYVMDSDGSGVQRLTNTWWHEVSPTWSPTGDRIAFQANYGGKWRIAVMDLATGQVEYITRDGGDAAGSPMWHSSGDWIYFQGFHYGDWDIYRVKPDGNLAQRVVYYPYAPDMLDDQVVSP